MKWKLQACVYREGGNRVGVRDGVTDDLSPPNDSTNRQSDSDPVRPTYGAAVRGRPTEIDGYGSLLACDARARRLKEAWSAGLGRSVDDERKCSTARGRSKGSMTGLACGSGPPVVRVR